jgi:hypothetical protein
VLKFVLLLVSGILVIYGVSTLLDRSPEEGAAGAARAVAGAVEIVPAEAYASSTLRVRRAGVRGAAGEVASCRWFRNGVEIGEVTTGTLGPGHFAKGDQVEAEVALDGASPTRTPAVKIRNTPPRILAASADLRAEPSAVIYLEVSAVDADGDSLSKQFAWFHNGRELPGQKGPTLSVAGFRSGDSVHARVAVGDGEEWSAPAKSDPIRIGSNAPAITSSPPSSLEEGRRFVYQIATSAPDPKSLDYELVDAPAGMTIDASGRVEWLVPPSSEEAQEYSVLVRVSDPSGGEATQRFRISTQLSAPAEP